MTPDEIEKVLTNWIKQATEPPGMLGKDIEPAKWVAQMFLRWWREKANSYLGDAQLAAGRIRDELEKKGGWNNPELGDTMEEITHLEEALDFIRTSTGLTEIE